MPESAAANFQAQQMAEAQYAANLAMAQQQEMMAEQEQMDDLEQAASKNQAIDAQIAELMKKTSSDYAPVYIILTVGAAVADLLQIVFNITVILWFVGEIIGVLFAGMRFLGVAMVNRNSGSSYLKKIAFRSILSGAVSLFPLVNILPEHTATMILEWQEKNKAIRAAEAQISQLNAQRQ